jgi:hypothetical protein
MAALVNPSNLYRGGAVVLNSNPSTNLAIQLMAKEQAKKDALNQFYARQQQGLLNEEKKMRPQDMVDPTNPNRGWQSDFNDLQNHYLQNRDAIVRPRTAQDYQAKAAYEQKYNDLMTKASQSINEKQLANQLFMAAKSPNFHMTDNDMNVMHANNSSIYDENGQIPITDPTTGMIVKRRPTANDLSVNVRPFDAQRKMQFDKQLTGDIKPDVNIDATNIKKDPTTGQLIVNTTTAYSPQKIKSIADNVPAKFDPYSPEYVNYDNQLSALHQPGHENDLAQMNQAYQKIYGATDANGNPNIIDSPEKLAQADIIISKSAGGKTEQKLVKDLPAQQQFQINKMYQQSQMSEGRQKRVYDYKEKGGKAAIGADNDILGYYSKNFPATNDAVTVNPTAPNFASTKDNNKYVDASKIDAAHNDIITNKDLGAQPLTLPDGKKVYKVLPNGDWEGQGGKRIDRQAAETAFKKWKTKANVGDAVGSGTTVQPTQTKVTSKGIKIPVFK